jgi:hypothetical protein
VTVLDEHVVGGPVLWLSRQQVSALEEQDALPGRGEVPASVPPPAALPMTITS